MVDSLSRWDYFVAPNIREYFEKNFYLTSKDAEQWSKYAEIRKKLNWEEETNLFEWAYQDFPNHANFSPLLNYIIHFESKKNRADQTLKEILTARLSEVEPIKKRLEEELPLFIYDKSFEKAQSLFPDPTRTDKPISVYLACSFDESCQGGANGDGMYSEIPTKEPNRHLLTTFTHEYLHKVLAIHKYLGNIRDGVLNNFYNTIIPSVSPDKLAMFFDEVIVYSLSDVITFNEDPKKQIARYRDGGNRIRNQRRTYLWEVVIKTAPVLREFLNDKMTVVRSRSRLNQTFVDFIKPIILPKSTE